MQVRAIVLFLFLTATVFAADKLADKWQKRISEAEATYATTVSKAEKTKLTAMQKASADKLKVLKAAMSEATKSGDFDAASALKEKVTATETETKTRPKPKNTIKFGGHEYALVPDKVTWNVARRRCEELGGHLVSIASPDENQFVANVSQTEAVWIGANDEEHEGEWQWVDGSPVDLKVAPILRGKFENENGIEHAAVSAGGTWNDVPCGTRFAFVCEWDD